MNGTRAWIRTGLVTALLSVGLATGCGDSGTRPSQNLLSVTVTPGSITLDALGATATLTAQLLDRNGTPQLGAALAWTSSASGVATITSGGVVTAVGNGITTVTARSGGASGSATIRVAQVAQGLASADGNQQVGEAGSALGAPARVRALDRLGQPASGASISFQVTEGGGSVTPPTLQTDAQGLASATWTLGSTAGTAHRMRATLANGEWVAFEAEALAGPADGLAVLAGDAQSGPRGSELSEALSVLVEDRFGNPVVGTTVSFTVEAGSGTLNPTSAPTGPDGAAFTTWTLGPDLGEQRVRAFIDALELDFTATATADPAVVQAGAGQNQTATVGTAVLVPPAVLVLDDGGLPVPDVDVTFTITAGSGALAPPSSGPPAASASSSEVSVVTDDQGLATLASWTLGEGAGVQSVDGAVDQVGTVRFTATATPGTPTQMTLVSGDAQSGARNAALPLPVVVELSDAFGNPAPGAQIDFAALTGGGSFTTPVTTGADGRAGTTWTLGSTLGAQTGQASVAGGPSSGFSATATAVPTALIVVAGDGQTAQAGQPVALPPGVRVDDGGGTPIPGVVVTFQVASGGGSVSSGAGSGGQTTVTTGPDGIATLNAWTLGPSAGLQQLAVSSGGIGPVGLSATATPGPPAEVRIVSGDGQAATAGTALPAPLVVEVVDAVGIALPGITVTFAPAAGSATPLVAVTGGDGRTQTAWTLGLAQGPQGLTAMVAGVTPAVFSAVATAPSGGAFTIEVRYLGAPPPASQQAIFAAAVATWGAIITADLPSVLANVGAGSCGSSSPAVNETIDDLVVFVTVEAIDGVGGVLGSAGPCWLRGSLLPFIGRMRFDAADIANMEGNGSLQDVVTHELGHVLGVGSLWSLFGLLQNPSLPSSPGVDTHFTGPQSITAFDGVGGVGYAGGQKVPVENTQGGSGTRDSHWREGVFDSELMTGFIDSGSNPLSAVTIASLGDLGYVIDLNQADTYALPSPAPQGVAPLNPGVRLVGDLLVDTIYIVNAEGEIVRVIRR